MQNNKTIQSKGFAQFPKSVLYDSRLNCTQKCVYLHMLDQYRFFSAQKSQYFESMESICQALNLSRKTVFSAISELQSLGLLDKTTVRKGESFNNVYVVRDGFKTGESYSPEDTSEPF